MNPTIRLFLNDCQMAKLFIYVVYFEVYKCSTYQAYFLIFAALAWQNVALSSSGATCRASNEHNSNARCTKALDGLTHVFSHWATKQVGAGAIFYVRHLTFLYIVFLLFRAASIYHKLIRPHAISQFYDAIMNDFCRCRETYASYVYLISSASLKMTSTHQVVPAWLRFKCGVLVKQGNLSYIYYTLDPVLP